MKILIKLFVLFIGITLLMNCNDAEIIPKNYPFITMKDVELSEEGALFRAQVMNSGSYKVHSFGFVWSTTEPNIENSDTSLISGRFIEGVFEKRINYGLAKGLDYFVRPFVVYDTITVYGNKVRFKSLGSQRNPWSLLNPENSKLKGQFGSFGSSVNGKGFVLFHSSEFYSYDPVENRFLSSQSFPVSGNFGSQFTSITIGNSQYFFNSIDLNLYKHENNIWTIQSKIPFRYERFGGYYQGHSNDNSIMVLSSFKSYEYNINTDSWIDRPSIPTSGYSVGGTSIGSKAYVVTNDKKIWEYDSDTHLWSLKTEYPGLLEDKIISFSYNDKVYFGLSYHDHFEYNNWLDKELWSFDPVQEKWELEEPFPSDLESGYLFYFFINNKLYIGHRSIIHYDIWVFDPSKD